ncbi:glycosyltransferase family 1 protein [Clostridium sp. FP1]|uniref:glycosyltransferase family 1 protein n=1 Tax=Clostridium sp. FP1 TaxID=2724076 RepID=UPI0013E93A9D|nr:glycosyltransferase family 1 protein [Clostridium sp. FP1]MBZ9636627.1 glycosyltransferase family 1 protein [Clostridium sp. FP1]
MKSIRVLNILHSMDCGGTETMIMNYYRKIDRNKIQFDFLLTNSNHCDYEEEILKLGGKIYRIPLLTKKKPWVYCKGISDFFKEHKEYRIVHSHTTSKSVIPLFYAKKNMIPVRIAHCHGSKSESGINGKIRSALRPFLKLVTTDYFACSKDAGIYLFGETYFNLGKINIIKNPVDSSKYLFSEQKRLEIRKLLNLDNRFVIGHVGRFHPVKNHTFLIDVFNEVHKNNPNATLVLIGTGSEQERIKEKVVKLKLTNSVEFLGLRNDVADLLQAIDVFVFPSLYEGLGLVTIEAQASGLPCVISDTIPKEVSITGLVKCINLNDPIENWAEEIIESGNVKRQNTQVEIIKSGYDISKNAEWLQKFYLKNYKRLAVK